MQNRRFWLWIERRLSKPYIFSSSASCLIRFTLYTSATTTTHDDVISVRVNDWWSKEPRAFSVIKHFCSVQKHDRRMDRCIRPVEIEIWLDARPTSSTLAAWIAVIISQYTHTHIMYISYACRFMHSLWPELQQQQPQFTRALRPRARSRI